MREIIKMIVVLSVICSVSGYVLATLKEATKGQIEEQVLTYVQGPALLSVLTDNDNDPIADRRKLEVEGRETPITVFPSIKDGKLVAVAMESFGIGYSGDVGVMVGFDVTEDRLLGIGITTQTETPGIGDAILRPDFTSQFQDHGFDKLAYNSKGGDLDAISGATYSSAGTMEAVQKAVGLYGKIKDQILSAWKS